MLWIILGNLLLLTTLAQGTHDERDDSFVEDLGTLMDSHSNNFELEVDDEATMDELRAILDLNGYDAHKLLADGLWSGLWGLVTGKGKKWALLNFVKQVSCYQGRSTSLIPAALYIYRKYQGYGCYCGGGVYRGNYLDATDGCCKLHDECYERTQKKYNLAVGCHTYVTSYSMTCCKREKTTRCTDTGPSAGRALCECDQKMAKCLAQKKVMASYNSRLLRNRRHCKATGSASKVYSMKEVLATCKKAFKPRLRTKHQNIRSQGKCFIPNRRTWW